MRKVERIILVVIRLTRIISGVRTIVNGSREIEFLIRGVAREKRGPVGNVPVHARHIHRRVLWAAAAAVGRNDVANRVAIRTIGHGSEGTGGYDPDPTHNLR